MGISASKKLTPNADKETKPSKLWDALDAEESAFVKECFKGLDASKLIDVHTHIVGIGTNDSGAFINPKMNAPLTHPLCYIKKKFFLAACGVTGDEEDADIRVAQVLADLQRGNSFRPDGPHGKCHIFAFDQYYSEEGKTDRSQTGFHVPNDWVFKLAKQFPDVFVPVASVHPYRPDALQELARIKKLGAKMIKWLPNSMHIDPSHPKCIPYYAKMKELDLILLTHTGVEHSVDMGFHQDHLGNPLLIRAPLDAGVRVIAAHCASEGNQCLCHWDLQQLDQAAGQVHADEFAHLHDDDDEEEEESQSKKSKLKHQSSAVSSSSSSSSAANTTATTASNIFSLMFGNQPLANIPPPPHKAAASSRKRKEHPKTSSEGSHSHTHSDNEHQHKVENFELWLKLMDDPRYDGLLFGDISSVTAHKRIGVLETLLNRTDLHHRLINGTDYPVPAVYVVIWSSQLRRKKLITEKQEAMLNKIFKFNPLLFDFCLKRCMRSSLGNKFSDCIFETHPIFEQAAERGKKGAVASSSSSASAAPSSKQSKKKSAAAPARQRARMSMAMQDEEDDVEEEEDMEDDE